MSSPIPGVSTDLALVPVKGGGRRSLIDLRRPVSLLKPPAGNPKAGTPSTALVFVLNCDGNVYIRDLVGNGGLIVNGRPVRQSTLHDGDELELGRATYRVQAPQIASQVLEPNRPAGTLVRVGSAVHYPLSYPVTTIATGPVGDIDLNLVPDDGSGEVLALVVQMGGRCWLWDLQTPASSRVDGKLVTRAEITEGSVVTVRGSDFQLIQNSSSLPQEDDEAQRGGDQEPDSATSTSQTQGPTTTDVTHRAAEHPAIGVSEQWGPLAFAVASLGQAEDSHKLGGVSQKKRGRFSWRFWMIVSGVALGLVMAGVAIYVAWGIWKRHQA